MNPNIKSLKINNAGIISSLNADTRLITGDKTEYLTKEFIKMLTPVVNHPEEFEYAWSNILMEMGCYSMYSQSEVIEIMKLLTTLTSNIVNKIGEKDGFSLIQNINSTTGLTVSIKHFNPFPEMLNGNYYMRNYFQVNISGLGYDLHGEKSVISDYCNEAVLDAQESFSLSKKPQHEQHKGVVIETSSYEGQITADKSLDSNWYVDFLDNLSTVVKYPNSFANTWDYILSKPSVEDELSTSDIVLLYKTLVKLTDLIVTSLGENAGLNLISSRLNCDDLLYSIERGDFIIYYRNRERYLCRRCISKITFMGYTVKYYFRECDAYDESLHSRYKSSIDFVSKNSREIDVSNPDSNDDSFWL